MACGEEWRRPLSEYSDDDNPWPRNADAELDIDPRNASFTEFFFGVFTEFFFVHSVRNRSTSTVSPRLRPILETDPRFFFVVSWYQVTFNSNRFQFWLLRLGHSTELTFTEFFFYSASWVDSFCSFTALSTGTRFRFFFFWNSNQPPLQKNNKIDVVCAEASRRHRLERGAGGARDDAAPRRPPDRQRRGRAPGDVDGDDDCGVAGVVQAARLVRGRRRSRLGFQQEQLAHRLQRSARQRQVLHHLIFSRNQHDPIRKLGNAFAPATTLEDGFSSFWNMAFIRFHLVVPYIFQLYLAIPSFT